MAVPEIEVSRQRDEGWSRAPSGGAMGAGYGLAFIGALVYYLQAASSFWDGVLGVFEAIFWPAFLVYNLLDFIHA